MCEYENTITLKWSIHWMINADNTVLIALLPGQNGHHSFYRRHCEIIFSFMKMSVFRFQFHCEMFSEGTASNKPLLVNLKIAITFSVFKNRNRFRRYSKSIFCTWDFQFDFKYENQMASCVKGNILTAITSSVTSQRSFGYCPLYPCLREAGLILGGRKIGR